LFLCLLCCLSVGEYIDMKERLACLVCQPLSAYWFERQHAPLLLLDWLLIAVVVRTDEQDLEAKQQQKTDMYWKACIIQHARRSPGLTLLLFILLIIPHRDTLSLHLVQELADAAAESFGMQCTRAYCTRICREELNEAHPSHPVFSKGVPNSLPSSIWRWGNQRGPGSKNSPHSSLTDFRHDF